MMTRTHFCIAAALAVLVARAGAAPYWITYEGNDFPENEGWNRNWGDWSGQYHGDGAIRSVGDGILTMDSLFDAGVYDFTYIERSGQIDPRPGEVYVMEWRVFVQETTGEPSYDAGLAVGSDDAWMLSFGIFPDRFVSNFEDVSVLIEPGVFHEYCLVSSDMRTYALHIDGALVHTGSFWEGLTDSYVAWGDFVQNVASYSQWDYVRVGVVPEAETLPAMAIAFGLLLRGLRPTNPP